MDTTGTMLFESKFDFIEDFGLSYEQALKMISK
jgi:hypothetical protein